MSKLKLLILCGLCGVVVSAACGPSAPPPPSPGKLVGQSCDDVSECQSGLRCEDATCVYTRCTSAPNPEAYCAERLGIGRSEAICDNEGVCRARTGGLEDDCAADQECDFGLVCEQLRCKETCLSDASCSEASTACLARASDPLVKVCQPVTSGCLAAENPRETCAAELGVPKSRAACIENVCEVIKVGEESCDADSGCPELYVCEDNQCARACDPSALEEQCPSPERCFERVFGLGGFCE